MLKISKLYFGLFFFCISILTTSTLLAQATDVLMTNSRSIDKDRYKGVKGSPYQFEDWQKGKIISVDADVIEGVLLNFNGKTEGFEIKKGDNFIELDPKWYIRVLLEEESGEVITFQKNFLPPLANKFTRVVYKSENLSIVEDFISKIEVKVVNNVGKKEEFKRFYSKRNLFLVKDKKITLLKRKKKSLYALLGHKAELEKFIKKEKLKLSTEAGLIKLFAFYEESGFSK
ncbi:MAG: hypothetical protein AB8G86_17955 [Saprospiraceae bacterium]